MPIFASFKKDWDTTKKEMDKIGEKKPTEIKTYGAWILKFEKRVSSGIGEALKEVDNVKFKDPKNPTNKEIAAFNLAVQKYRQAMNSELNLLNTEVDKYRGENGKVDKASKDGFYRALKVFKTKLEHYDATLEQQAIEMQQALDKVTQEGDKRIAKFRVEAKQHLTKAAAAVKSALADPAPENYEAQYEVVKKSLAWVKSEANTIATWSQTNSNVDMREGAFGTVFNNAMMISSRGGDTPDQIKASASALGKQVAAAVGVLGQVKES